MSELPAWLSALGALATVIVALYAAKYAKRAAHWTKEQAVSAREQEQIQRKELELAIEQNRALRADVEQELARAERAEHRQTTARLDAIAPTVFARAVLEETVFVDFPGKDWSPLEQELLIEQGQDVRFKTTIWIDFKNVSTQIAQVSISDAANGDLSFPQGRGVLHLLPGEDATLKWVRQVTSLGLSTEEELQSREKSLFALEFLVRDVGSNTQDTYLFNGDLRYFRRDGSRLIAKPEPAYPWTENIASPTGPRRYPHLELRQPGISPAGE